MMSNANSPRLLTRHWTLVLLPPAGWAAALGSLFTLTGTACERGTRTSLWVVAVICLLLAVTCAPLAWRERRARGEASPEDRVRFMMEVAMGLSAFFSAILIVTAVPILLLDTCRT
jgi:hypothetical protein